MITKYFMSQKTYDMWVKSTNETTYNNCPIEIDDSIKYGGVEHLLCEEVK